MVWSIVFDELGPDSKARLLEIAEESNGYIIKGFREGDFVEQMDHMRDEIDAAHKVFFNLTRFSDNPGRYITAELNCIRAIPDILNKTTFFADPEGEGFLFNILSL